MPEHLGVEDVDARVDRVGEDLPPGRLLEEALDPPVRVGDDDAELERVLDRLEADRDGASLLPVVSEERLEVDVAERVARDDEERLVEVAGGQPDRAGSSERRLLDRVVDRHPERLAVAEVGADRLRHEGEGDDHLIESVPVQQLEDVLHAGLADDRHHRLRLVRGQRAQSRALAPGHHDRPHLASTTLSARPT